MTVVNAATTTTRRETTRRTRTNFASTTTTHHFQSRSSFVPSRFFVMVLGILFCATSRTTTAFSTIISRSTLRTTTSTTALFASSKQQRGLEQRRESPTPTEGGMILYCKSAEDGKSVGDCPFAHYNRLVLEEKGLEYDLKPTAPDSKPSWLTQYYEGKMPALRHRKECYVESSVIAEYLEYFFPSPSLSVDADIGAAGEKAELVLNGFFPAVAKYLKDTEDADDTTAGIKAKLQQLEDHLASLQSNTFLCGTDKFTLLDARLVPMLYHLETGNEGFKNGTIDFAEEYPKTSTYMQLCFQRPSFQATLYPKETVLWGWGNARK